MKLHWLPEVYRVPVVLCCLEGCTQDDAAAQVGWTAGSLKGRLERGRKLLRGDGGFPAGVLGLAEGGMMRDASSCSSGAVSSGASWMSRK
jgi:hypothetical protein